MPILKYNIAEKPILGVSQDGTVITRGTYLKKKYPKTTDDTQIDDDDDRLR